MSTNLFDAHRQWANRPADQRYQTLEALSAAVQARRNKSRSVDIDLSTIQVKPLVVGEKAVGNDGQTIVLNRGFHDVEPTHWSFGQLATNLHAPASYLRELPTALLVQNLNHGIQRYAKDTGALKFMTISREDGGPNTLQAVTSTTYGRIWDADVAACATRIVERTNGRFYNPKAYDMATGQPVPSGLYASDRDIFIFMIDGGSMFDVGPRAQLNRGFILYNSEVGSKKFGLKTFLFNVVCGNHIIWGAQDIREVSIRHTLNGPARFDSEAMPGLLAYVNASAKPEEDAIRKAQNFLLPAKDKDELIEWANKHGKFSRSEVMEAFEYAKREEGDCRTLFQFVQGGTAYARGFDYADTRTEVETRFSKLLDLAKN